MFSVGQVSVDDMPVGQHSIADMSANGTIESTAINSLSTTYPPKNDGLK
jgi:hypothetical protein